MEIDRKELILLLTDCQLHLNRLKARDNQEKIRTVEGLERARNLLLVAKSEPNTVRLALIEVKGLLEQIT